MADFKISIPFIKAREGGLSRDSKDSASKHPAPWLYKGVTGWHTNKGITYSTFAAMAPKLGYSITAENFFVMPEIIWQKIYKTGYWDQMKCDLIKSNAIAIALVDYAFNFGPTGALKRIRPWLVKEYNIIATTPEAVATALNKLSTPSDTVFFSRFIEHRKEEYRKLNNPAEEPGWLTRMDKLKEIGSQMLQVAEQHKTTLATTAFFFDSNPCSLYSAGENSILV